MKISWLLPVFCLAACSPATPSIPLKQLTDQRLRFNGQNVRACGVLYDSFEACVLVPCFPVVVGQNPGSVPFGCHSPEPDAWVEAPGGTCMPGKANPMDYPATLRWAIVEGQFVAQTGRFSKQIEYRIRHAKIELQDHPCAGYIAGGA